MNALGCVACGAPADDESVDGRDDEFAKGKADGAIEEGSPAAIAVLNLVNDPDVSAEALDDDAGVGRAAAENIIANRPYALLAELDAVPFVGPIALQRLLDHAIDLGLMPDSLSGAEVVFTGPEDDGRNDVIADLIDGATRSVDIAMHRFSSDTISRALERAVARGVSVRFLFDEARRSDRELSGQELRQSQSGRLEIAGVDVRYPLLPLGHRFAIIDGPRHDLVSARWTRIISGSADWTGRSGEAFDGNTVLLGESPEMALRFQKEFNLLWEDSADLKVNPSIVSFVDTISIDDGVIPDDMGVAAYFTSANADLGADPSEIGGPGDQLEIAGAWLAAIDGARESIILAAPSMRLKVISDALIRKKQDKPSVDIRVYLDQSDFQDSADYQVQLRGVEGCLGKAESDGARFACENRGTLWGHALEDAGIEVRYKIGSYHWHPSYAQRMQQSYVVVDGEVLVTGSYGVTMESELHSFENAFRFEHIPHGPIVAAFQRNHEKMWKTGRAKDFLDSFADAIEASDPVPLVFEPMALTREEWTALQAVLREGCAPIDSSAYRDHPEEHLTCPRGVGTLRTLGENAAGWAEVDGRAEPLPRLPELVDATRME